MLGADGQADGVLVDAHILQLLGGQLGVGGGGRVDDQALHVSDVGQQREDLQVVDELKGFLLAALDVEGEDGRTAVGEVLLVQGVVGMVGQAGMIDVGHLRVMVQELHDLLGVLVVAVQAQRQGLGALQQQPGVERADAGTGVTQDDGADVGNKGGGAGSVHEANAVIAGVRLGESRELAAGLPVELAGIDDDAAQGGAVAADELGGGVNNNVSAVLNGADQVRGAEGVVDDQGQAVLVGNLGNGVNVGNVRVGVAQGLQVDGAGVLLDGVLDLGQIVGIHKGGGHAESGQGVLQQVGGAAVDGLLGNDVAAVLGQGLDGVVDGGGAGSHSQGSHAALKGCDALLEHILGGVGQTAVNVAGVLQVEAVSGVLGVMEHVGSGLVNRHGAGIGDGVSLLLANMPLQGLKMVFTLAHDKILISVIYKNLYSFP